MAQSKLVRPQRAAQVDAATFVLWTIATTVIAAAIGLSFVLAWAPHSIVSPAPIWDLSFAVRH